MSVPKTIGVVGVAAAVTTVALAVAPLYSRPTDGWILAAPAAGFAAALALFAAAPRLRRDDLSLWLVLAFGACTALRALVHDLTPWAPLLQAAGVGAAWLPGRVEGFRRSARAARAHEDRRVSDWARKAGKRSAASSGPRDGLAATRA